MLRHRIADGADYYRLPAPPRPHVAPTSFMLMPVIGCYPHMKCIQQWALDQAIAIARPAVTQRPTLCSPN